MTPDNLILSLGSWESYRGERARLIASPIFHVPNNTSALSWQSENNIIPHILTTKQNPQYFLKSNPRTVYYIQKWKYRILFSSSSA